MNDFRWKRYFKKFRTKILLNQDFLYGICVFCVICEKTVLESSGLAGITAVKSGIECIEVPGVQVILGNAQGFTEALVVDDLPGSEELDGFTDIRILDQAQNVVVGGAGFLFWGDLVSTTYTKI